jgi:uncharacterized protein YndB with AHSA1/START domain
MRVGSTSGRLPVNSSDSWANSSAVTGPHLDINGVPVRGRYLELDPPHRLLISWGHAGSDRLPPGSSTVEITLTPIPDGTRVTVEHRDLPPEDAAQHAAGWPHFLARLSTAARGDDAGPDPFAGATTGNG